MKKNAIKSLLVIILSIFILDLSAGVDFAAIKFPKSIREQIIGIQNYIASRLGKNKAITFSPTKPDNMHITLKEIGDLKFAERKLISNEFKELAKNTKPEDLQPAFKKAFLKMGKKGIIKLMLPPNAWLTNLAHTIDNKLKQLKDEKKIGEFTKRMDFPKSGHTTLGVITYDNKALSKENCNKIITKLIKDFDNSRYAYPAFNVDRFELLKSNSPAKERVYTVKDTYFLSK